MATSSRRRRAVVLGSVLLVVGLVGAVVLWAAGGSRRTNAIKNFARAPIGCDTTLDFAEPGSYLLFVETAGRLEDVRGDCDAPSDYDVGADRPNVEVTMIDPDGEELALDDASGVVSYSSDGFVGGAVFRVEVAEAADHVVRVESRQEASFAVAIGRDPDAGVALLRGLGVAVGVIGLAAGLGLILAGGRHEETGPAGPWTPAPPDQPVWGATAPTQPPYRQPPSPAGQPPFPGAGIPSRSDLPRPPAPPGTPGAPTPASVPPVPDRRDEPTPPSTSPPAFAPPSPPTRVDDGWRPPPERVPPHEADIWDDSNE